MYYKTIRIKKSYKMIIPSDLALKSKTWPWQEAFKLKEKFDKNPPPKGYVLFETGYGPSGLPHIGTFGEVARTTFIRNAFSKISNIPTKLICFSDDMDGLRKVPINIPNQELIAKYLNYPLTAIPDPFGEEKSYGHYMNKKLCSFLDRFEFNYEFYSAAECYKSGMFDKFLLKVLDEYDAIMQIMLPTLRSARQATYSPFLPICSKTGRVLQVPIVEIKKESGTIIYEEDNKLIEVLVTGGNCKLQWKPDFAMRWAALEVDYEMYGKEHRPSSDIYNKICTTLGGTPPVQFFYELFLTEEGSKISKSKGNSITVDEWLKYAGQESLALFMYHSPSKAKRLHFDVIVKTVDEYLKLNKQYHDETEVINKIDNPLFHIHNGNVPIHNTELLTFNLLLNLVIICHAENKNIVWEFINKYYPNLQQDQVPYLNQLIEYTIEYYRDLVKDTCSYLAPNDLQKSILQQIISLLEQEEILKEDIIQNGIYTIGANAGYSNLRNYFKELYQILLGREDGPRLGSLLTILGKEKAISLIKTKINT